MFSFPWISSLTLILIWICFLTKFIRVSLVGVYVYMHLPVVETLLLVAAGLVVGRPCWQALSALHPCQKTKHTNKSHEQVALLTISVLALCSRYACESGNRIRAASCTLAITCFRGNGCLASPCRRTLASENTTPTVIMRPVMEPPSRSVASVPF